VRLRSITLAWRIWLVLHSPATWRAARVILSSSVRGAVRILRGHMQPPAVAILLYAQAGTAAACVVGAYYLREREERAA